jgi:hypothetical protein
VIKLNLNLFFIKKLLIKFVKNFILSTIIATTAISTTAIAEDFQVYAEIGPSIGSFAAPILSNLQLNISVGGAYKIDSMFFVGLRVNIQDTNYNHPRRKFTRIFESHMIFTSIQAEVFAKVYNQDTWSVKLGLGSGLRFENTNITGYEFINSCIMKIDYALKTNCALSMTVRHSRVNMNWYVQQNSITFGVSYNL